MACDALRDADVLVWPMKGTTTHAPDLLRDADVLLWPMKGAPTHAAIVLSVGSHAHLLHDTPNLAGMHGVGAATPYRGVMLTRVIDEISAAWCAGGCRVLRPEGGLDIQTLHALAVASYGTCVARRPGELASSGVAFAEHALRSAGLSGLKDERLRLVGVLPMRRAWVLSQLPNAMRLSERRDAREVVRQELARSVVAQRV